LPPVNRMSATFTATVLWMTISGSGRRRTRRSSRTSRPRHYTAAIMKPTEPLQHKLYEMSWAHPEPILNDAAVPAGPLAVFSRGEGEAVPHPLPQARRWQRGRADGAGCERLARRKVHGGR
jgi:hypothetical protein